MPAGSTEVVKLTAPIVIKLDKKSLSAAKKGIQSLAEALEEVVKKVDVAVSRVVVALDKIGIANQKAGKGTAKQVVQWDRYKKKAVSAINKANKEIRKQDKLLKKLRKEIQGTTKDIEKQGSKAKRTAKAWGKIPDIMAQIRTNLGLVEFAAAKVFQALAIPAGVVIGSLFFLDRINATTTEMSKLAEVSGVSLNFLKAMNSQAKLLGLNIQNVADLAEELGNKVGGQASGFEEGNLLEGFSTLAIDFEKLKKLKPEEQFTRIASAAQKMLKEGKLTLQEIGSAGDKIFGGEGNRLLTILSKMNVSLDDFLERQNKISGLGKDMEQDAVRFTMAFNDAQALLGKLFIMMASSIGGKLAPSIELMLNRFLEMEDVVEDLIDEFGELFTELLVQGMLVLGDIFKAFNENKAEIIQFLKSFTEILVIIFKLGISLAITAIKIFNSAAPIIKGIFNTLRLLFFILSSFNQEVFDILVPIGLIFALLLKIKFVGFLLAKIGIGRGVSFTNILRIIGQEMRNLFGLSQRLIVFLSEGAWMTRITSFLGIVRTFLLRILSIVNPIAKVLGVAGLGFLVGKGITKATGIDEEDSRTVDFFSKAFEGAESNFRQARFQAGQDMERFARNRAADRTVGGDSTTNNNSGGNTIIDNRQFNLDGQDAVDAVNELQEAGPMQLN